MGETPLAGTVHPNKWDPFCGRRGHENAAKGMEQLYWIGKKSLFEDPRPGERHQQSSGNYGLLCIKNHVSIFACVDETRAYSRARARGARAKFFSS